MSHRALTDAWAAGRPAFGGWISGDSAMLTRAVATVGFDWVGLDCQHGRLDEAGAARIIRELPDVPCALLARVSQNSPAAIGRVLDAGADGVIVPLVNDADEARAAVRAIRYPPDGERSYGPTRPGLPSSPRELAARADCFVMIETEQGLANADEILAVPGVTGAFVGPSDLSIALGFQPLDAYTTDQLHETLGRIRETCERRQVVFGIFANSPESAVRWKELGAAMIAAGSELGLLNVALRRALDVVHGRLPWHHRVPELVPVLLDRVDDLVALQPVGGAERLGRLPVAGVAVPVEGHVGRHPVGEGAGRRLGRLVDAAARPSGRPRPRLKRPFLPSVRPDTCGKRTIVNIIRNQLPIMDRGVLSRAAMPGFRCWVSMLGVGMVRLRCWRWR